MHCKFTQHSVWWKEVANRFTAAYVKKTDATGNWYAEAKGPDGENQ